MEAGGGQCCCCNRIRILVGYSQRAPTYLEGWQSPAKRGTLIARPAWPRKAGRLQYPVQISGVPECPWLRPRSQTFRRFRTNQEAEPLHRRAFSKWKIALLSGETRISGSGYTKGDSGCHALVATHPEHESCRMVIAHISQVKPGCAPPFAGLPSQYEGYKRECKDNKQPAYFHYRGWATYARLFARCK